MAMIVPEPSMMTRLAGFSVTTPDANRLCAFYRQALGFRRIGDDHAAGSGFQSLMGGEGGVLIVTIALGQQTVDLVQFDRPGRPYPAGAESSDLIFQHFAIVVSDMHRAYARLLDNPGWTAISSDGPVRLPESSGGVTAFKFRDPDGHPLELLAFAKGRTPARWDHTASEQDPCLGIDHSAIGVGSTARSIDFYRSLGLHIAQTSLNKGPEQALLDHVHKPVVEVTSLCLPDPTPHVELLCYRGTVHHQNPIRRENDISATRMMFEREASPKRTAPAKAKLVYDPDGHGVVLL
jgi:catechol 2,3-dioxygenase-like lactoylglutathione lyase family enzyme